MNISSVTGNDHRKGSRIIKRDAQTKRLDLMLMILRNASGGLVSILSLNKLSFFLHFSLVKKGENSSAEIKNKPVVTKKEAPFFF